MSRRPADSDFKQQRLPAFQPILTPAWVIGTFFVVGLSFVIIGAVLKSASDNVVEYVVQYDGDGTNAAYQDCMVDSDGAEVNCTITITAQEDMEAPVYVYYQLENFYQNHRRYVKSRSDAQLRGEEMSLDDLDDCDPLKELDGDKLSPCGLIANSLFTDQFDLVTEGITMDDTNIAWDSDVEDKFVQSSYEDDGTIYLKDRYSFVGDEGVENEHFIVWMRTAGLPNFRKLYGHIDEDIAQGQQLQFNLTNSFYVQEFEGTKSLVVSTTSWFGGKNSFLGVAYIVVGSICLALAAAFALKHKMSPRNLGDTHALVWKTQ